MRLYCIRHGEASSNVNDNLRRLTENGRLDVSKCGHHLAQNHTHVTQILHSGVLRAVETAEILQSYLRPPLPLQETKLLVGDTSVRPIAEMVEGFEDDMLLVTHMPLIGKLVSILVTGQEYQSIVAIPPATLVILEKNKPGVWTIVATLPPSQVEGP